MGRLVQRQWQPDLGAYGGRRSRQGFLYDAYIPDPIAELDPVLPSEIAQVVVGAEQAIWTLNEHPSAHNLEAVARQLLRSDGQGV